MNANQILNMVLRTVMRRLVNSGVNAGIDAVARRGRKGRATGQIDDAPQEPQISAEERARIREIRQARRAARARNNA